MFILFYHDPHHRASLCPFSSMSPRVSLPLVILMAGAKTSTRQQVRFSHRSSPPLRLSLSDLFLPCPVHPHVTRPLIPLRSKRTAKIQKKKYVDVDGLDSYDRVNLLSREYFHSTTTLHYPRSLLTSEFASLHHPRHRSTNHLRSSSLRFVFLFCSQDRMH